MSDPERIGDWELKPGALWVLPNGSTYPVRGFHKEWLNDHPQVAHGYKDSTDVIIKLDWLSVVMLAQGQLELCVSDLDNQDTVANIQSLLNRNDGRWNRCLIISMSEEGFVRFTADEYRQQPDAMAFFTALRVGRTA